MSYARVSFSAVALAAVLLGAAAVAPLVVPDAAAQDAAEGPPTPPADEAAGPTTTCDPTRYTCLQNPLNVDDPRVIIGQVIRVSLGVIGSLSLIIFVYGGLLWMTSAGNTERITQGRNTLLWATLGMVVIFASYTIVNFIIQSVPKSGG